MKDRLQLKALDSVNLDHGEQVKPRSSCSSSLLADETIPLSGREMGSRESMILIENFLCFLMSPSPVAYPSFVPTLVRKEMKENPTTMLSFKIVRTFPAQHTMQTVC